MLVLFVCKTDVCLVSLYGVASEEQNSAIKHNGNTLFIDNFELSKSRPVKKCGIKSSVQILVLAWQRYLKLMKTLLDKIGNKLRN